MRRFFVKNLLFVIAVNLLVKPLWIFLIDRTVQNRVGHSIYGTYQALFNLGIIFQIILDFGLNNYNTKVISQNPEKIHAVFPEMLSARIFFIFVYGVFVSIVGWFIGYGGWEYLLLAGCILVQALSSMLLFIRSNVAALHRFKVDGVLSITDRLLMIIICSVLLFVPYFSARFKIEWFVLAQIASYGFAIIAGLLVLRKISRLRFRFSFSPGNTRNIIKQSAPYALLIFLMSVYTRVDTILIERLSADGKAQAGIYAAGYRLLDVGNMLGLMFASMLLPLFGRMLVQKQDVNPIVLTSANIILPFAFIVSVSAAFFGTEIMNVLYTDAGVYDGQVFALLMACFPAFCIMYIYSTLLTANGNLALLNKIAFTGVVINVVLNIIFIPRYGAIAAAATALITQIVLAVCFIISSRKRAELNKNPLLVFSYIAFVCLLVVSGCLLKYLPVSWVLQLLALAAAGVAMLFIFRFVTLSAVQKLFEKG